MPKIKHLIRNQMALAASRGKGYSVKKMTRIHYPKAFEAEYARQIKAIAVQPMRAITQAVLFPKISELVDAGAQERRVDAVQHTTKMIMQAIRATTLDPAHAKSMQSFATTASRAMAEKVNAKNKKDVLTQLSKAISVDVWTADPLLEQKIGFFVGENTSLITNIPEKTLGQVQQVLEQGVRRGARVQDIQADIMQRFRVSDSRAELIARDQIGKLNGDLTQMRHRELGIKNYVWRTAGDDRVRDTHEAQDGETYSWEDPPAETGNPGEDFQCRCIAEPDLSDFFDS